MNGLFKIFGNIFEFEMRFSSECYNAHHSFSTIKDEADFLKRTLSNLWTQSEWKLEALDKAGAFELLYRNDKDVDLDCVHEWVNMKFK